ncbi:MAG: flavin reductase family protein [Betaproteobacteria bacterium]|nr:flavin reductase family protein [Betaproteobacteria bacterium]
MPLPISSESCPELRAPAAGSPCATCDTGRSLQAQDFDCRAFRDALGSFATGVTVVTALAPTGERIGLTVSSFNSVSLDPPLILWSLSRGSPNLETFQNATHFSVNVLAANQQEISDRFAARNGDRFADVPLHDGVHGNPLLDGCCACFECSNEAQYPGGDHIVFIGRVEKFAHTEALSPLVFHNGGYRRLQGV